MPLHAMEKYLYPTLRVMQHLHSAKGPYEYIPGGVESMIVYSLTSIKEEGFHKIEPNATSGCSGIPSSLQGATSLINFVSTLK